MKIKQLEAFYYVYTLGTVVKAAEVLHLSQPAVSMMIQSLEHEIGLELFLRKAGRLIPTPGARELLEDIRILLQSLKRIKSKSENIRSGHIGRLTIAAIPLFTNTELPGILSAILQNNIGANFDIHSKESSVVKELLETRSIDVGVTELPVQLEGIQYMQAKLICDAVVPRGHNLESKDSLVPEDFAPYRMISLSRSTNLGQNIHAWLSGAPDALDYPPAAVNNTMLLCDLVELGVGVGIAPRQLMKKYFLERVSFVPLVNPPRASVTVSVVLDRSSPITDLFMAMAEDSLCGDNEIFTRS